MVIDYDYEDDYDHGPIGVTLTGMPTLATQPFTHFGGTHWVSAGLRNTLAHYGVVAPHTKQPLSEAMCFGLGGGIAAGYSFCPSIPNSCAKLDAKALAKLGVPKDSESFYARMYQSGSGVAIIGRQLVYATSAGPTGAALERLGIKINIKETAAKGAALKNLMGPIGEGQPVFVWTAVLPHFNGLGWPGTCGMYTTVITEVDEDKGVAYAADCAPTPIEIPLDDLAWARNRVCSLKNRTLTIDPAATGKKLSAAVLKKAVIDALKFCVGDFKKPKLSTFNLPGLLKWSKAIASDKNKKEGWPLVYPKGMLYLALRDAFGSIESAGTGGGLFRPMFADFLDEAAKVTGRKTLGKCADTYRALADDWTSLAEALLPNKVAPFRKTKQLMRKRRKLYLDKGTKAATQINKAGDDLREIEADMLKSFPLDEAARGDLLASLSDRIAAVHDAEKAAADALAQCV